MSSELVRVELARVARVGEADASTLHSVLAGVRLVAVTSEVLDAAARFVSLRVRTLDAIHLASALTAGATEMLVYDLRLAEAAEAAGLVVLAPGA